jgi:cytochrome c peroxidase
MCTFAMLSLATIVAVVLPIARPGSAMVLAEEPITPIPTIVEPDAGKVVLGERLFRDVRLSHDGNSACTSCHDLERGGDDKHARPFGADGRRLDFNTSTIFNAALSFRLNWRGNFRTLQELNEATLLSKSLMNTSWEELLPKLHADQSYLKGFADIYGAEPQRDSVLDALAAYQRSLTTPNARFDRYLRGDQHAITTDEQQGYRLFKAYGCIACHQGANIGGNLFQKFGVFADPFAGQKSTSEGDLGRLAITGAQSDLHVFRVPSLRNIAVTAPYFHDGRTASLQGAVEIMARSQLGRELAESDVDLIVKFLGTLTGEYRGRLLGGEAGRLPQ